VEKVPVTREKLNEVLKKIVEERPEYVYQKPAGFTHSDGVCRYVHLKGDGYVPGCLIGHLLNRLGVSLEDIIPFEGGPASTIVSRLIDVDSRNIKALDWAQNAQDSGEPWGEAYQAYLHALSLLDQWPTGESKGE
jgi:hypothetical protein